MDQILGRVFKIVPSRLDGKELVYFKNVKREIYFIFAEIGKIQIGEVIKCSSSAEEIPGVMSEENI